LSRISASSHSAPFRWHLAYLAVALTAAAALLLELSLTRIFSVVFYYHFAFLAISIALFGLGAGGVLSYVLTGGARMFTRLGVLSALNSLLVLAALVFVLTRGKEVSNLTLALIYFYCALPFLFAGAILSTAIAETIQRVHRVYFFDLLGAAGGCLLLVPLLNVAGGPNTVIASAALFAGSAAIWFSVEGRVRGRIFGVILALGLFALIFFNARYRFVDVQYAKGRSFENEIFAKWNSFSRVALLSMGEGKSPYIVIDADAGTAIPYFQYDRLTPADHEVLFDMGAGVPYMLRPGGKTLVIGPGGGWDVARAVASGSRSVTGVEINPIIANTIMQDRFAHYSNKLYLRPEVRIVVEDGRAFVRRSQEKYDILQATLVDTWASTAAGAFALTENNLYTTEAFHEYLSHLQDGGLMAFTRWGFDPPRESLRLVALAIEALERLGEREAWRHVVVVRDAPENLQGFGSLDTVMVFRKPVSPADLATLHEILAQSKFEPIYVPGSAFPNPFTELLLSRDREQFYRTYPYQVGPVSDNKPFFFYTVQTSELWRYFRDPARSTADTHSSRAIPLLFSVLGVSLLAMLVILLLPPLVFSNRLPSEPRLKLQLAYFVLIGVGYILIEVALIQKFVLFLGHPVYALTVIIFSMLVSSGVGSLLSRRLAGRGEQKLYGVLISIAGLVAVLALVVVPVVSWGVGWPLSAKVLATLVLIAPAGLLMGVPFPRAYGCWRRVITPPFAGHGR
jgi:predicted membrane-bound spermidine synthase